MLCVELLKSAKPRSENPPLQFSRSEVVQTLTMFLGFLDWTRPTDGNYDLCRKLLTVIKGIIDGVLDSPPSPRTNPTLDDNEANNYPGDHTNDLLFDPMMAPVIETHDLNWLNTMDWTQGDWLDFNQPPIFQ